MKFNNTKKTFTLLQKFTYKKVKQIRKSSILEQGTYSLQKAKSITLNKHLIYL